MKVNSVIVVKDDVEKVVELPKFGEITIKVQDGNPIFITTTEQTKI